MWELGLTKRRRELMTLFKRDLNRVRENHVLGLKGATVNLCSGPCLRVYDFILSASAEVGKTVSKLSYARATERDPGVWVCQHGA